MTNDFLSALREIVHAEPDLQERLFRQKDTDGFIAELLLLAESRELPFNVQAVQQAIGTGQRDWLERRLP